MRPLHSAQKYPMSMILLHALLAVLMITTLLLGWSMEGDLPTIMLHKSMGALVLILGIVRILNRILNRGNTPPSVNTGIKYTLEKVVHGLLMLMMVGIPLGGWLTSNAYGYPVSVFGLFNLPNLVGKDEALGSTFGMMHEWGANAFLALLILHVAGAVVHLVVEKQNIFKRMLPW